MKQDLAVALVRAHYANDEPTFKRAALQAAARSKSDDFKKRVEELTMRPRLLMSNGQSDFVVPVAPVSFDDLILDAFARGELTDLVAEHRSILQLRAHGLDARRRLLFHGPPGNGKTSAAAAVATELGISCYAVSLARIVDSHMGATAANLAKLFPALGSGICLILDEIDSIGSARQAGGGGANREANHTVNSLLTLLDRTEGGVFVATTNRRDMLDPALLRRFDFELEFTSPNNEQRARLRDILVERHRISDPAAIYLGESWSYDDVTKACRAAARREAIREAQESAHA